MSTPPRLVIQQNMARIASLYHASATFPHANHSDYFNTHSRLQSVPPQWQDCEYKRDISPTLERKLSTTAKAMKEVFGSLPRCWIALETGMHSPWVSRVWSELGHEVIVAHARSVRLRLQNTSELK
jgi:hypothetical protein